MKRYDLTRRLVLGLLLYAAPLWTCPLRAQEPFDYFRNSWSVIGLKDYNRGTRITPDNELMIGEQIKEYAGAEKATVRLRFGRQLTALSRQQTKRLMDGWLPVVLIRAEDGPVRYDFTLWATPLPSVRDWQKAFDWPTEGENFLNWILVKATNTGTEQAQAKVKVEQKYASAEAENAMSWSLAPGKSAEGVVRIPWEPIANASALTPLEILERSNTLKTEGFLTGPVKEGHKLWLDRTVEYWRGVMAKAAHIEVPCRKATDAFLASHVCQLIANDHGEVHAGEGFYDSFWLRDGAYQVMEYEESGMPDAARKAVEIYLRHQRPDGRFSCAAGGTQKNQFDGNGQAVWVLWQYYKITADRAWLERVYPQMRRAVDWTMKARREAPADSPFAGLLPAAPADGENLWNGKYHIVGYDIWNLRGLLCTADAARILGRTEEANELSKEADLYRNDIEAARKRTGLAYFPASWEKAGTHWGNTETLWPTELFARDDRRVTALIAEVRNNHGGGFIEGTIQWLGKADVIHPYMSAYTTMASLARGEHEQVVEDFYWYLLHSTATHAFGEGIYYKHRTAWSNTIPHATGASNYAIMLRHMLIHEQGDELHLLSAVPDWWLDKGNEILIERAPTYFGPMNLRVTGTPKGVRIKFDPPNRQQPKRIVLYLPESRRLAEPVKGVEVVMRANQKNRWDFQKVLGLYRQKAASLIE